MPNSSPPKITRIILKPYPFSAATQSQMLKTLAMRWDGQWFLKTVEAFGLEAAITINAKVRTASGRIEMRTVLKAVGKDQAKDLTDALCLIIAYNKMLLGGDLQAEVFLGGACEVRLVIKRCGAYEGAKLASLPRADTPCVACETLWLAWLETLMPDQTFSIDYPRRQGMGSEDCLFVISTMP